MKKMIFPDNCIINSTPSTVIYPVYRHFEMSSPAVTSPETDMQELKTPLSEVIFHHIFHSDLTNDSDLPEDLRKPYIRALWHKAFTQAKKLYDTLICYIAEDVENAVLDTDFGYLSKNPGINIAIQSLYQTDTCIPPHITEKIAKAFILEADPNLLYSVV